jgi:membrane associated rhomboid family serine protease
VRVLLVANIAVFLLQHLVFPRGTGPFWHSDSLPAGGVGRDTLADGRVWTLFTYMFVHSGFEAGGLMFLHILGNLLIIFFCGRPLQQALPDWKFYLLYFGGGLTGALFELAANREVYMIGASAGALAILLACAAMDPERRVVLFVPLPVELRMRTLGRAALIISAALGVLSALSNGSGNGLVQRVTQVAHFAHLGGGLFGLIFMKFLGYRDGQVTRGDLLRGREGGRLWGRWGSRRRRPSAPPERSRPREEVEYDAVLDKVSEHGLHSLTEEERKALEHAAQRIRARQKRP